MDKDGYLTGPVCEAAHVTCSHRIAEGREAAKQRVNCSPELVTCGSWTEAPRVCFPPSSLSQDCR